MYSLTLLLKAKKLLWFIYDPVTLSKTEFLNAPEALQGEIKAKVNLASVQISFNLCRRPSKIMKGTWVDACTQMTYCLWLLTQGKLCKEAYS